MGQGENAVRVLSLAAKLAKTPEESQAVDNRLMNAQEYAAAQRSAEQNRGMADEVKTAGEGESTVVAVPHLAHRKEFVPSGPHRFLVGTLKSVHCDTPVLELTVSSGTKTVALRADNYYKIEFTAINFQQSGDLNPCSDLENRSAKVEYVESIDKTDSPHLIAIELHK
jgi:hypothetical protein